MQADECAGTRARVSAAPLNTQRSITDAGKAQQRVTGANHWKPVWITEGEASGAVTECSVVSVVSDSLQPQGL